MSKKKYVYLFSEGNAQMRELLGGKGANLAEMTGLGLPVPPGFTVTTEACTQYYEDGKWINEDIVAEIFEYLGKLEKIIDLGDRFILHHDYALDDDGNIVSLATDLTRSDHAVQDQAIKVNTSTGKVTKLVDFGEMFPDYKASTGHSGIDESDPAASGSWDWIHFNTIQLLPDGQYYIYMFDNDFA